MYNHLLSLYGYTFLWMLVHICFHKHCPKHEQWLFILGGYIAILGATDICTVLRSLCVCVCIIGSASVMKRDWGCCYEKFHPDFAKGSLELHTVCICLYILPISCTWTYMSVYRLIGFKWKDTLKWQDTFSPLNQGQALKLTVMLSVVKRTMIILLCGYCKLTQLFWLTS